MSLHLEAAKRARRRSEASRRLDLHGMQLNGGEPIATNSDALDDKTVCRVSTRPGAPLLPRFLRQSGSFAFIPQATFRLDSTGNPASRHASNPPLRAQA